MIKPYVINGYRFFYAYDEKYFAFILLKVCDARNKQATCVNSYITFSLQTLVVNFQVLGAEDGSIKAFLSHYLSAKIK